MRTVFWSDNAIDDLDGIVRFVAEDNPRAATALADSIDATATRLADFPVGRPGRVGGSYEKSVLRTPYIIAYALTDERITVLRVIHGSRDWPEGEWPSE